MADPSTGGVEAGPNPEPLTRPQFIIEAQGVYYLTQTVWAYDPEAGGQAATQGVEQIKATFDQLFKTAARLHAVELPEVRAMFAQHTGPV